MVLLSLVFAGLYLAQPRHREVLLYLLVPEQLAAEWAGGTWSNATFADRLPLYGWSFLLLLAAVGTGQFVLASCRVRTLGLAEWFALTGGVGFALWSTLLLAVGLAGGLRWIWLWTPLSILAAAAGAWFSARQIWLARSALTDSKRSRSKRSGSKLTGTTRPGSGISGSGNAETAVSGAAVSGSASGGVPGSASTGPASARTEPAILVGSLQATLLVLIGVLLLAAPLPPWDFDVREYHLQVPKEWWLAGRVTFLPHNVYGNMPLGAEMHPLWAMATWPGAEPWYYGALVGKILLASFAPLTAALLIAAGTRWWNSTVGYVAAILFLAMPWTVGVSTSGMVDGVWAYYTLATWYALAVWAQIPARRRRTEAAFENRRDSAANLPEPPDEKTRSAAKSADSELRGSDGGPNWLLLAGWMAGAGIACKYPAAVMLAAPAAVVAGVTEWLRRRGPRESLRHAVVAMSLFSLAAFAAGGLWLAKNAALTGNPVYPLLGRYWDGKTRTPEKIAQWDRAHQVPRNSQGRRYTPSQLGASLADLGWKNPWASPLLLPWMLIGAAWSWRQGTVRGLLLIIVGMFVVWWTITHRIPRFMVPALPLASLLAAVTITAGEGRSWRITWSGILLAGVVVSCLANTSWLVGDNRFFVALEQLRVDRPMPVGAEQDLQADPLPPPRMDPLHAWLNQHAQEGEAVLLVGDAQPFDLTVPVYYSTCFDDCLLESWCGGEKSLADCQAHFRQARIGYVLIHWAEIERYRRTYGFSDWVTPARIQQQFVQTGWWKAIDTEVPPEVAQLFRVTLPNRDDQSLAPPRSSREAVRPLTAR